MAYSIRACNLLLEAASASVSLVNTIFMHTLCWLPVVICIYVVSTKNQHDDFTAFVVPILCELTRVLFDLYAYILIILLMSTVLAMVASSALGLIEGTRAPIATHPTVPEPCSICLETGNGTWMRTPCNHHFHRACITQWQAGTCPMCRSALY